MSDVAGRAVIEVTADTSKLSAGIDSAKRSVASLGEAAGAPLEGGFNKGSRAIDGYIKKLEQSASTLGKTAREVKLLEFAQRGASQAQLNAADAAMRTIEAYKEQQREARKTAAATEAASAATAQNQARFLSTLAEESKTFGMSRAQLLEYRAAQLGVTQQAAPMIAALAKAQEATRGLGAGQKLTAHQTQQLSFQLNDLFVQIASGQSPITALIQQGSQLNGTFGGVGGTLRAIGSLITPFRVAVGGAAAVVGALALAYKQGAEQAQEYRKALILTGNAAGTTVSQMTDMAARIDDVVGTQAKAAEVLALLAGSGRVGADNLEQLTTTAIKMERVVGQSIEDTVKQFAELAKAPAEASVKFNETMNYLTVSIYEQIKALQEQGRTEEAAALAQKAYSDALSQRTKEIQANAGYIERSWMGIKDMAKEAWDAMLGVGRQQSLDQKIAQLEQRMADANKNAGGLTGLSPQALESYNKRTRAEIDALKVAKEQEGAQAKTEAAAAKVTKEYIAAKEANNKWKEAALSNTEKANNALEEYRRNNEKINAGLAKEGKPLLSSAQIAKEEAAIRESFAKKGGRKKDDGPQIARAQLGFDLDDIRNAAESVANEYSNAEKLLEARRAAGLVNEQDYYDARRAFISLNADLQIKALQDENDRIAKEGGKGADLINNQKKIADNVAKIATLQANAATNSEVLNTQQAASIKKVTQAYDEAEIAARTYLNTINQQYERDLAGIGQGEQNRRRNAGMAQIEDRYAQQLLQLESDKRQGGFLGREDQYEKEVGRIKRFQAEALQSYSSYYDRLIAAQSNWVNGASEALANYYDESRNIAGQTESLFTHAFDGLEDAIVQFTQTGKLSFSDLVKSLNADIARIAVKESITGPLAGYLKDAFGIKPQVAGDPKNGALLAQTSAVTGSTTALIALTNAANAAAGAISGSKPLTVEPGSKQAFPSMGDFTRADRALSASPADTAEATASALVDARSGAQVLGDTAKDAATVVASFAASAGQGGIALAQLPAIINLISAMAATSSASGGGGGGAGGLIGSLISAGMSYFGGGSSLQVETVASGAVSSAFKEMPNALRGGREIGGPVSPGGLYRINEKKRPELLEVAGKEYLMMGSQSGNVKPNAAPAAQQPLVVNNNFAITGAVNGDSQGQIAAAAARGVARGRRQL